MVHLTGTSRAKKSKFHQRENQHTLSLLTGRIIKSVRTGGCTTPEIIYITLTDVVTGDDSASLVVVDAKTNDDLTRSIPNHLEEDVLAANRCLPEAVLAEHHPLYGKRHASFMGAYLRKKTSRASWTCKSKWLQQLRA
jgi:polyhydroxyalkanoate synthesis regulator protein